MTLNETEHLRDCLQNSFNLLIAKIGPIAIGKPKQFPYGWRKAAKGRTVWRIVEEVITQNLEKRHRQLGITKVVPSDSEVSVYDLLCRINNLTAFVNIKSAVSGGRKNKDDISKAEGLHKFYMEDPDRQFFIATFFIKFEQNMTINFEKVVVFPVAWLKKSDIYVNPSNNGNLQATYFKDLSCAEKRVNQSFIPLFEDAIKIANEKKKEKTQ